MFASSDTHTITNCLPLFSFCQYCYVSETHHPLDLCSFCVLCLLCIICFFFSSLLQRPSWFKVGSIEGCCFFCRSCCDLCSKPAATLNSHTGKNIQTARSPTLEWRGFFHACLCVLTVCVCVCARLWMLWIGPSSRIPVI